MPSRVGDTGAMGRSEGRGGCATVLGTLVVVGAVIVGTVAASPQMDLVDLWTVTQVDRHDGEAGSGGEGYSFMATTSSGAPVTWGCDARIEIEVNPVGAPRGYEDPLASAVARVNEASSFTFVVAGETTDRDFDDRYRRTVLLGWADEDEVEGLAGTVAGLGGATYVQGPGGGGRAVGGSVVVDTDAGGGWFGLGGIDLEVLLVHELLHVLGLGHSEDPGQLMAAENSGQSELGEGDLAGLAALREAACS